MKRVKRNKVINLKNKTLSEKNEIMGKLSKKINMIFESDNKYYVKMKK